MKSQNTTNSYWPHKEIIEKVSRFSPNSKSVIAILPDTKELNTFNLSAEADLQNSNVYIRQIISNDKSYKDDIDRFNWFLIKNGEQGVMSSSSKLALSNLVETSNKFENFESWELPDGSKAKLYKRKKINESISIIKNDFTPLNLDLIFSSKGITARLKGNSKNLNNGNLLIDVINNEKKFEINIALPEILNMSNNNIEMIKNINFEKPLNFEESLKIEAILIANKNEQIPIHINKVIYDEKKYLHREQFEINKIEEVEKMGQFLKFGQFDQLFDLVSLVNQSDPNQEYLKDSERIFQYRYRLNKSNYDYLYNIAISQILQRESMKSASTLKKIIKFEKNNPNLYLAKSIVDIYNFNPRQAEKNIQIASNLNKDKNLYDTINTIKLISDLLNFRFSNLIKI